MTVCIAAIYNNNAILGVSDRMITAGDIQFEPPAPKIVNLTNSIAVMTAGDSNLQTRLLSEASTHVRERIDEEPEKWIPVRDVATFYKEAYSRIRISEAEAQILAPLGLDYASFLANQNNMSSESVSDLSFKLQRFSIENVATIIAGIDEDGPHIFVVRNDNVTWNDRIGFAAVGSGSNHALSHFMLSGYTGSAGEAKSLLTVHQAKKKSEVSPGVGPQTDLFVIGPRLGTFQMLMPVSELNLDIIRDLDSFYKKYQSGIRRLDRSAEEKIQDYLNKLGSRSEESQEAKPLAAPEVEAKPEEPSPSKKTNRPVKKKPPNDSKRRQR